MRKANIDTSNMPRDAATGGPPRLFDINDVKDLLGMGRSGVYHLLSEGRLPEPIRFSTKVIRWRADEFYEFLEQTGGRPQLGKYSKRLKMWVKGSKAWRARHGRPTKPFDPADGI
jgi:predicted DNA-binding transcriptional regulator AlpA